MECICEQRNEKKTHTAYAKRTISIAYSLRQCERVHETQVELVSQKLTITLSQVNRAQSVQCEGELKEKKIQHRQRRFLKTNKDFNKFCIARELFSCEVEWYVWNFISLGFYYVFPALWYKSTECYFTRFVSFISSPNKHTRVQFIRNSHHRCWCWMKQHRNNELRGIKKNTLELKEMECKMLRMFFSIYFWIKYSHRLTSTNLFIFTLFHVCMLKQVKGKKS